MKSIFKRTLTIFITSVMFLICIFPMVHISVNTHAEGKWSELDEDTEMYNMSERVRKLYDYLLKGSTEGVDDDKIQNLSDVVKKLQETLEVDEEDDTASNDIMEIPKAIANVTSSLWDTIIGTIISTDPTTSTYIFNKSIESENKKFTFDPLDESFKEIVNVFTLAAYSIVLIFFSVSIIEQTVKFEIFSMKGALQIFGRLLVSKLIIDMSTKICGGIIAFFGETCVKLIGKIGCDPPNSFMPRFKLETSKINIVGPIVDTIVSVILAVVILAVVGTVFIMTLLVSLKLVLRSFELTMLVCTSPVFFACASSDVTKEYFKKFIVTFIEVSAQTLFMCVAMIVGMKQLTDISISKIESFGGLYLYFHQSAPYLLILIAMCVCMIKPPKVLTGLLK